jgi:hypothetical protein
MAMKWQEEFDKKFLGELVKPNISPTLSARIDNFISTEIIEKLIDEYPTEQMPIYGLAELKQQLRDKWL